MKKLSLLAISCLAPFLGYGQGASLFVEYQWEIVIGLMIMVGIVSIMALLVVLSGLKAIVRERRSEQGLEPELEMIKARPGEEHVGFWTRFWNRFNSAVPVAMEETVETSHEYDGIRELDNQLPPWWLYGFYISIIFGVIYLLRYEVLGTGLTQEEEYLEQMAEANREVEAYLASIAGEEGEIVIELLSDEEALAAGAKVFQVNCAQCHAADGGGMNALGPNLTDKYWKNGGDFDHIVSVIQTGVSGTSMIPWESQLSAKQIQEVSSFVYSLEDSSPANPKDPEGELFERLKPDAVTPDSTELGS